MTINMDNSKPLDAKFFRRAVEEVAPDLIGCFISTNIGGGQTGGMIIEVEAYDCNDPAAHCHGDATQRRRNGSAAMMLQGGNAYIHLDRGMPCLNLTCDREGFGSAVLIRSLLPVEGAEVMSARRSAHKDSDKRIKGRIAGYEKHLCNGPGKVGEALGLDLSIDGVSLLKPPFELKSRDEAFADLLVGPRINITKAVDVAWRWGHGQFRQYLSKPFKE